MARPSRTVFLKPPVQSADLVCQDSPKGVLPHGTSTQVAAERIVGIDEAGEDCRQVVHRSHDKLKVYEEIVEQLNKNGIKVRGQ